MNETKLQPSEDEDIDQIAISDMEEDSEILLPQKPGGVSISDLYREGGYLYRHYCRSRATILAVTMPAIFAVGWILIGSRLDRLQELVLVLFAVVMLSISLFADSYYAKHVTHLRRRMERMEKFGNRYAVHLGLETRASKLRGGDKFSYCVYAIALIGFGLIASIYPRWIN